jgi:pimeloyl-ACP methyl ester carboxylesterase
VTAPEATQESITSSVESADGTAIGFRRYGIGRGPAIVVLHGTMSSAYNHHELALDLADQFDVIVPDRRGRGMSGPTGEAYSLTREVEDVDVILQATGATRLFGVSSGAIVALESGRVLPQVDRIAAFEPPLFRDPLQPRAVLERYDREIARGDLAAALITGMKGAEMGPAFFRALPRWLTERLTASYMAKEVQAGTNGYLPMATLAPLLSNDFRLVVEVSGDVARYSTITAAVLLMFGSKTPRFLKDAIADVHAALPDASVVELPGLDHAAAWNRDRGGNPQPIVTALRGFFA